MATVQLVIPTFRIHKWDEFLRHYITTADEGVNLAVLVEARATSRIEDHFRCHLFGNVVVHAVFQANRLLSMPEAEGILLRLDAHPAQVQPDYDSTATRWFDLQDALQDGSIIATDKDGSVIPATEFWATLCHDCPEKEAVGASIRWSLVVNSKKQVEVALQGLPCPQKYLKPTLRQDNVATVRLAKVDIRCEMGDEAALSGPIPILFSPDQAATQHVYSSNPNLARSELNKELARFLHMEHFTAAEAVNYVNKPCPTARSSVFFNTVIAQPPAKRPRTSTAPSGTSGETGTLGHITLSCTVLLMKTPKKTSASICIWYACIHVLSAYGCVCMDVCMGIHVMCIHHTAQFTCLYGTKKINRW
jgi:hypothetical protein